MIEVNPPKDWQPPSSESIDLGTPLENDKDPSEPVTTSFDDIDHILDSSTHTKAKSGKNAKRKNARGQLAGAAANPASKTERPRTKAGSSKQPAARSGSVHNPKAKQSSKAKQNPKASKNPKTQQNSTAKPTNAQPVPKPASSNQPILPTDDWTSQASKQRKRAITIIASVVGAIVLSVGIVAAIFNYSKKPSDNVTNNLTAEPDDPTTNAESPGIKDPKVESNPSIDTNNLPDTTANSDPPVEIDSTVPPSIGDAPKIVMGEDTLPPVISDVSPPTIAADPPTIDTPSIDQQDPSSVTQKILPVMNPLDGMNRPIQTPLVENPNASSVPKTNLRNLDSLNSNMEDLSDFLSAKGTSIFEIKDLAEANRERRQIGIPKYYIEKPESKKIDVERQLSMTCSGLRYTDTSLLKVLRDITAIIGVPITLDVESIAANGASLNPKIDVDVQEADFGEVIDSILQPLGLTKTMGAHSSLIVKSNHNDEFEQKTHLLPDFPVDVATGDEKIDSREVFVGSIQALITPQAWVQETNPATIELTDQEVTVSNSAAAHYLISEFITKIQAAITLSEDLENPAALQALSTRWNAIAERLAKPAGIPKSTARPLVGLLNEIHTQTGVAVIVDWENLLPLGWNPQTRVPGDLSEKDLESTLRQLARSMNLTIRPIDQDTIELTTFEKSAATTNLEVYHMGEILDGQLSEPLALSLIKQALSAQLRAPNVQSTYEPKCKCWVVLAPQSLQKQMGSVIKKLESLR